MTGCVQWFWASGESVATLSPLAQSHWTHQIQAPLFYRRSSRNYPTSIYLHNLISVRRLRSSRSSSIVTLARPPTSSSLKITDRSLRYTSPCLWTNSLYLFVNLILVQFLHFLPTYSFTHHFFLFWFNTLLIHNPPLFHSLLKTYLFHKSYRGSFTSSSGLPSWTIARTVSSELLGFCF